MFFYAVTVLLLLTVGSCHKKQEVNPNSFYMQCEINGNLYIPNGCANCSTPEILHDTTLLLPANNGFESLGIGINDHQGIHATTYVLNDVIGRQGTYKYSTVVNDRYYTDATHRGKLTITLLDKTNQIIQGTFFFTAYNLMQNDSVKVTDGKFRLQYVPY
jgi:Family of unknown function (DUF6252)